MIPDPQVLFSGPLPLVISFGFVLWAFYRKIDQMMRSQPVAITKDEPQRVSRLHTFREEWRFWITNGGKFK